MPISDCVLCTSLLFIGVFGGLDLHGKNHSVSWTSLSQTASAGSNQIRLETAVDWVAGDQIVIATTTISAWQTELMTISAVSSDDRTLTLTANLQYQHKGMYIQLSSHW